MRFFIALCALAALVGCAAEQSPDTSIRETASEAQRPQRFAPPVVTVTVKRLEASEAEPIQPALEVQPKASALPKREAQKPERPTIRTRSQPKNIDYLRMIQARERERDMAFLRNRDNDRWSEREKDRDKGRGKGKKGKKRKRGKD